MNRTVKKLHTTAAQTNYSFRMVLYNHTTHIYICIYILERIVRDHTQKKLSLYIVKVQNVLEIKNTQYEVTYIITIADKHVTPYPLT